MPKTTLSVQLLTEQNTNERLRNEIGALEAKIVTLEKDVAREKNGSSSHFKSYQEAKAEIEQVHQLLDAVPNSVARRSESEESYNRVDRDLMTRLAAWLAAR